MKYKLLIWSKDKNSGKNHRIESHEVLTQEDIEHLALEVFKECHTLDDNKEYYAELDKTIHD